ncbi:MAG: ATP-binding cassette domain-containing protein, partial [Gemmatimonadota bacterium]
MRISVQALDAFFGANHAVRGVTMDIPEQRVTAIIGPSGCGKSTFLRTINRMHETVPHAYTRGRVLLDGEDIYAPGVDPVSVRRHV